MRISARVSNPASTRVPHRVAIKMKTASRAIATDRQTDKNREREAKTETETDRNREAEKWLFLTS